jgi:hypothetical protein
MVSNKTSVAKLQWNGYCRLEPVDVIVTETEIILKPIYFENNRSV